MNISHLIAQIYEALVPLDGQVNHNALGYIRRAYSTFENWWKEHDELQRRCFH